MIKLITENIGINICVFVLGNVSFKMITREQEGKYRQLANKTHESELI